MIVSYTCTTPSCELAGKEIPDIRTWRGPDGVRICTDCQKPLKIAETINVSSRRRSPGRIISRRQSTPSPAARPPRPRRPKIRTNRRRRTTRK